VSKIKLYIQVENNSLVVSALMPSWRFVEIQVVFFMCGWKKGGLSEGNRADKLSLLFDRNNCSPLITKERAVETRKFHLFRRLKSEYSDIYRNKLQLCLWLDSDP
jgi:hypothetical protein